MKGKARNTHNHIVLVKKKMAVTQHISHENRPYFACADFLIFPIDLEWSPALGSFKMKV